MRLKSLLILTLSFYAIPTYAQYKAGIQGVVVDPQGSVVEGATVTLTSKETNISKTTTSDSSGIYNFLSLAPGRYAITVEKTGFKKQSLEDVVVAAEQTQVPRTIMAAAVRTLLEVPGRVGPVRQAAFSRRKIRFKLMRTDNAISRTAFKSTASR